jgi:hypothetical protein
LREIEKLPQATTSRATNKKRLYIEKVHKGCMALGPFSGVLTSICEPLSVVKQVQQLRQQQGQIVALDKNNYDDTILQMGLLFEEMSQSMLQLITELRAIEVVAKGRLLKVLD